MPGINGRLTIRVSDGQTDRIVTKHCSDLRFVKVSPGGHQEITFTMVLPRGTFRELGPQDRVWLYTHTGRCIFDGYIENPTPVDGPLGQRYEIRALGGMALANDESRGLIYVDTTLDGWEQEVGPGSSSTANMRTGVVDDVPNTGIELQFPDGQTVANGAIIAAGYRRLTAAGMTLGSVRIVSYAGKNDTGWRLEMYTDDGSVNPIGNAAQIQTVATNETFVVGTHFGTGALPSRIVLQLRRAGAATNVADDLTYGRLVGLTVMGQRVDRNGTLLTGTSTYGVTALNILASQVAEDLLGRLLTFCDPTTAVIDPTAWPIDQLAFPDGVKAAGVLNELANWEPDFTWEIGETLDSGLHRFAYRAWPLEPRYEVSVKDGWEQQGSDVDLCNRVLVTWTDATGKTQTEPVTAADVGLAGIGLPVDELGTRIKDADPITLPEGFGSLANAVRIGGQILRDAISPPKAGKVVVQRPIVDRLTGNLVQPWELEPGYLLRIRETGDELRIPNAAYDDGPVAMTLTLGTPVLTREERLARLDAA